MSSQAHCPIVFDARSGRLAWAASSELVVVNWSDRLIVPTTSCHTDTIRAITFANDTIVTAGEDKRLVVWSADSTGKLTPISQYTHGKKLMVVFADSEGHIGFGDKFGEFYRFKNGVPQNAMEDSDSESESSADRLTEQLFGHLSAATVGVISRNIIITADRDEKIRIARYPRADIIESFLFGHRRYVSQLVWANDEHTQLVSAAADGVVMMWDLTSVSVPKKIWSVSLTETARTECPINTVAVGGSERRVFVVRSEQPRTVLQISSGELIGKIEVGFEIQSLWVSPEGIWFAVDSNSHLRCVTGGAVGVALPKDIPGVPISYLKAVHHENIAEGGAPNKKIKD
jgi:WD40 repeat protein